MKQFKVDWNIHPDSQNVALKKTLALVRRLYLKTEVMNCIPEDVFLNEFIAVSINGDHSGIGIITIDISQIAINDMMGEDFEKLLYITICNIGRDVYNKEVVLA